MFIKRGVDIKLQAFLTKEPGGNLSASPSIHHIGDGNGL